MDALGTVNGSSALEACSLSARADDRDQHGVIPARWKHGLKAPLATSVRAWR
jgi:hypothetical protein